MSDPYWVHRLWEYARCESLTVPQKASYHEKRIREMAKEKEVQERLRQVLWKEHSPLHAAAEIGYLGAIRILCEAGANLNANQAGMTPLESALRGVKDRKDIDKKMLKGAKERVVDTVRLLGSLGVDVCMTTSSGETLWEMAMNSGRQALADVIEGEMHQKDFILQGRTWRSHV